VQLSASYSSASTFFAVYFEIPYTKHPDPSAPFSGRTHDEALSARLSLLLLHFPRGFFQDSLSSLKPPLEFVETQQSDAGLSCEPPQSQHDQNMSKAI